MGTLAALVADVKTLNFETSASATFGGGADFGAYESFGFVAQYSERGRSHETGGI